jgi:4-amino-4-deoxy-L-arabinose transferase-like glycosyltransferase
MVGLTVAICVAWILPGLIGHDPWKPDEAYTFGLVYHVLQGGGWIVPMLAGEPFVEKPPLFVLTAALFAKAFSPLLPAHDGARLAAGFYVALAFAFTAAVGRELYGRGRGWVATLILLGTLGLMVRAHQMITDTALFAGFAIGAYGLARCLRRPISGGLWLGTGAGLGFMAKGFFAPSVLGIAAIALMIGCRAWRTRAFLGTLAIALSAALPWLLVWPLLLYSESPTLFFEWLWTNNVGRFFSAVGSNPHTQSLHYLAILPWYAWPSLPLALWVLWGTRVSGFRRPAIELPCVLFLTTFIVLSLAPDAREVYAMPMLIALALLATPAVGSLRRGASNALYWFGIMAFSFFAAVFWFYWVGLDIGLPERLSKHLHKLQPGYDAHVRWLPLLVAAALSTAWIFLLLRLKRSLERPVVVWAAGITLLWGIANSLFLAYVDTGKSYRSMIAALTEALPKDYDCISSRALGESQRALLHYYSGIVTQREESPARSRSCSLVLHQGARTSPPAIPPGWHQRWEGTRPGEKVEYFWLYAFGPPRAQ